MEVQTAMPTQGVDAAVKLDPQTLNFIERIRYYENLNPMLADNDNQDRQPANQGSACFDAWAIPDFMRR